MKLLVVGDPHIQPQDLEEGERLGHRIGEVARASEYTAIVLMGDLFHTHSLVHVEVLHFWRTWVERLSKLAPVYVLLGNHDGPHDMSPGVHALAALRMPGVTIIDKPHRERWAPATVPILSDAEVEAVGTKIGFVPFMRSNEDFIAACKALGTDTVYCHQEFDGCRYDNGFYAKHGVNPDDIPQKQVVSGHIHTGQEFGKVWYVGAPRWMTASDANQDRFIWTIEHDQTGAIISRTQHATDPACRRMVRIEDTPETPADVSKVDPAWKLIVDVRGPAAWVNERKDLWRGKARLRTFVTEGRKAQVRESEGIGVAFGKYLAGYQAPMGTAKGRLETMVKERLGF